MRKDITAKFSNFLTGVNKFFAKWALLIIPVTILLPGFSVYGVNLRLENILSLAIIPVLVQQFRSKNLKINLFDLGFVFLAIAFVTTILFSYLFKSVPFNPRDFFDIFRIFNYFLLYRFVLYYFTQNDNLKRFKVVYIWTWAAAIIFAVLQYFDLLGVNRLLYLYTTYYHIRVVLYAGRVVGTFGSANEFAAFMGSFVLFIIAILLYSKNRDRLLDRRSLLGYAGAMALGFFCIFATMSRGSLMAVFAGISSIIFFFLTFSKLNDKIRRALTVMGVIFVTSFLAFGVISIQAGLLNRATIVNRFEAGLNEAGVVATDETVRSLSFSKRMQQWAGAVDVISENPFLGYGPSKATKGSDERPTFVENEYLGIAMNYGVLGLLAYSYLYLVIIRTLFRSLVSRGGSLELSYSYWLLGSLFLILVYNIFQGVFFRTQAFDVLMILFGMTILMNEEDLRLSDKK